MSLRILISMCAFMLLCACGSDGFTDCGSIECSPGQFCESEGSCAPGCTSDVNCLDEQFCSAFDDDNIGSCSGRSVSDVSVGGNDNDG